MCIQGFLKALCQLPLSQEDRATLTGDELFVLVLARRLDRLTKAEGDRMEGLDLQFLASEGLVSSEVLQTEANMATAVSPDTHGGNVT